MARNTAPKRGASPKAPKRPQQNTLKWPSFILGTVVGVVGPCLVFLAIKQSKAPVATPDVAKTKQEQPQEGQSPYFDFYAVLPDMEVVVPTDEMPASTRQSQSVKPPKRSKIEDAKPLHKKPVNNITTNKSKDNSGEYVHLAIHVNRTSND